MWSSCPMATACIGAHSEPDSRHISTVIETIVLDAQLYLVLTVRGYDPTLTQQSIDPFKRISSGSQTVDISIYIHPP
jgi:hypothetical protein